MRVFRRVGKDIVDAAIDPKDLVFVYSGTEPESLPISLRNKPAVKAFDSKKHDYLVLDKDGFKAVSDVEYFGHQEPNNWPILSKEYKTRLLKELAGLPKVDSTVAHLIGRLQHARVGTILHLSHQERRLVSNLL